jgi:hypothetical protein
MSADFPTICSDPLPSIFSRGLAESPRIHAFQVWFIAGYIFNYAAAYLGFECLALAASGQALEHSFYFRSANEFTLRTRTIALSLCCAISRSLPHFVFSGFQDKSSSGRGWVANMAVLLWNLYRLFYFASDGRNFSGFCFFGFLVIDCEQARPPEFDLG